MTGLHAALAALAAEHRAGASPAPYTSERALIERVEALLAEHEPSGQVDHEQSDQAISADRRATRIDTCANCGDLVISFGDGHWAHYRGPGSLLNRCQHTVPYGQDATPARDGRYHPIARALLASSAPATATTTEDSEHGCEVEDEGTGRIVRCRDCTATASEGATECQMHGPGSIATPNDDGIYEPGCTCPEPDESDCTCQVYVVDHSDPEPHHPENLDREDDPDCPVHGSAAGITSSDDHLTGPEQQAARALAETTDAARPEGTTRTEWGVIEDRTSDGLGRLLVGIRANADLARRLAREAHAERGYPVSVKRRVVTFGEWVEVTDDE